MTNDLRAEFTAGLRQFADWLDANTDYPVPARNQVLLPLTANPAVEEFAAKFGLSTVADKEGNLSAEVSFGPVSYLAYGYVDFTAHLAASNEHQARTWAAKHGLQIVTKADGQPGRALSAEPEQLVEVTL